MESEEDHTGRHVEVITQSGLLKHYLPFLLFPAQSSS